MKQLNVWKGKCWMVLAFIVLGMSLQVSAQKWGKYTLVATQGSATAKLIDTTGATYKTWSLTGGTGYSSYLLESGVLLRTVTTTNSVFSGGGMHGRVQKVAWNGTILWDYTYSTTTYCAHHDICPMPNGNVLMIVYELKTAAETVAAGCSTSKIIWPDKIVEIKPTGATTGTIVWEWHVWDHLVQNTDATKANYQSSVLAHPELLNINYKNTGTTKDWMHSNGLDYNEALDQITFSSHNLNEVYVIDHSTTTAQAASHSGGNSGKGGDFLYRWGNPAAYGATGTANFNVIHDAHWIPANCPRGGSLVGFNNGASSTQSGADIFYPPYDGYNYSYTTGSAYLPTAYGKRILFSGKTTNMGNSQQLPNGNTLYCIALSGSIYEVDSNGTQLWSFSAGGTTPQASRYSNCYVNGPSAVIPSGSSNNVCAGSAVQLNANASGIATITYSWSANGGSFTSNIQNPIVNPTANTTYTVVATSNGCSTTNTITMNVKPKPTTSNINGAVSVLSSQNQIYRVSGSANSTYTWLVNGGIFSTSNGADSIGIIWGNGASGNVKVIETNSEGCLGDTMLLNVVINTSSALEVTPSSVNFASGDSTVQLKVSSDLPWQASANQSWVALSKNSGSILDSLTITCSANALVNGRNAIITFVSGSNVFYVYVNQAGLTLSDSLSLSTYLINTSYAADSKQIQLFSNNSWVVTKKPNWITLSNESGNSSATLTVNILKNAGAANRSDSILFNSGTASVYLVVNQGFESDVLNIDIDTIKASYIGKVTTVNITTNRVWVASASQSWVTLSAVSGNLDGSTDITIAANPATERTATVTFLAGNLLKNIIIIQDKAETGIAEMLNANMFNVFPNPATETIEITGTAIGFGNFKLSVYNSAGMLVAEYHNATSINVTDFKAGLYQIQLYYNTGKHYTKKILINK